MAKRNLETFSYCSPVVGDIDGDGEVEIVAGSDELLVYAWDIQGNDKPGWPWVNPYATRTVGVVLADIVGDEALEVIINHNEPGYWNIFAIDGSTGTALPGWPQPEEGDDKRCDRQVSVSDIDNDGEKEIIVASYDGCHGWVCYGYVLAYNPDGTLVPGFPISLGIQRASYTPCIVDLDQDGDLEICVVTDWGYIFSGDCYLHVWDLSDPYIKDQKDWRSVYHDSYNTNNPGFLLPTDNPIDIELSPDTVTVSRGNSFDLTAIYTNRNVVYQSFKTALFLRLPNGTPYGGNPLIGPISFHQKMRSAFPITQPLWIPVNAPLGNYHLTLPVGTSIHNIMDMDSTVVHVVE